MKIMERVRELAREPLAHFLIAGALVFLVASWRGSVVDPADRTITIDEAKVTWLARQFEQTWQRTPSPAEIDQLIRDYVKEEVYYREALRMGLDQDDPIIRRRLRSKMEFLASSEVESTVPDNVELQALLDKNPARYATQARFSFDQVYLGDASDDAVRDAASGVLVQLKRGENPARLSRAISLPASLEDADADSVTRRFGDDFAPALAKAPIGTWIGPVASGYGLHLVRVRKAEAGVKPKLADVRQRVENDWRAETLETRTARAYQVLLDGYRVKIEKPE